MKSMVDMRPTRTRGIMRKFGKCERVFADSYVISNEPIASLGYLFCRGVVLYDGKRAGVIHLMPQQCPVPMIERVTEELDVLPGNLQGIVTEADEKYPFDVKGYLSKQGIRIEGHYTGECYFDGNGNKLAYQRDLIVIPRLGEVHVCTRDEVELLRFNC